MVRRRRTGAVTAARWRRRPQRRRGKSTRHKNTCCCAAFWLLNPTAGRLEERRGGCMRGASGGGLDMSRPDSCPTPSGHTRPARPAAMQPPSCPTLSHTHSPPATTRRETHAAPVLPPPTMPPHTSAQPPHTRERRAETARGCRGGRGRGGAREGWSSAGEAGRRRGRRAWTGVGVWCVCRSGDVGTRQTGTEQHDSAASGGSWLMAPVRQRGRGEGCGARERGGADDGAAAARCADTAWRERAGPQGGDDQCLIGPTGSLQGI